MEPRENFRPSPPFPSRASHLQNITPRRKRRNEVVAAAAEKKKLLLRKRPSLQREKGAAFDNPPLARRDGGTHPEPFSPLLHLPHTPFSHVTTEPQPAKDPPGPDEDSLLLREAKHIGLSYYLAHYTSIQHSALILFPC